jgi:YD repeat-containing protein
MHRASLGQRGWMLILGMILTFPGYAMIPTVKYKFKGIRYNTAYEAEYAYYTAWIAAYGMTQCSFSQWTWIETATALNGYIPFNAQCGYGHILPIVLGKAFECPSGSSYDASTGACETPKSNGASCAVGTINAGNPINAGTGNKWLRETDLAGTSSGLAFERYYNASSTANSSAIGFGWVHTYSRSILVLPSGTSLKVYRQDGKTYSFNRNTAGLWTTEADVPERLDELKDSNGIRTGWRYTTADQMTETYEASGKLITLADPTGATLTLTYSDASTSFAIAPTAGLLIRVTDHFERQLNFTYDANSRLSTMTDPANGLYQYAYDAADNLASVTYPDETPTDSTDDLIKTYVYGELSLTANVVQPHALTGIIDENDRRYATYTYDNKGRALVSEHAGGAGRVSLVYNTDGSTSVTDALNTTRTYRFQTVLGVAKSLGNDQPGGSGCAASASALGYDANGNVASRTDFNGNVSCYAYDLSRNLETVRLEGLASGSSCPADLSAYTPPAGSNQRKISTQWHATFRLPVKITEPGLETTYGYDGKGEVTLKSLKDLATQQVRAWTIASTYAAAGSLLSRSEDGPRTDVADVTVTDYYPPDAACAGGHFGCRGQLQQITRPGNQLTRITRYSAHGQPEEVIDPNGLITTLTYDARQHLVSQDVGGEVTTYDYDPAGLVRRVTWPGGATLDYRYDDAHRLVEIEDQAGNTATYTLDPMGNRIQEDLRDPGGQLARRQSRVYDALSRLQNLIQTP